MRKMTEGSYGDIWTWIHDEDIPERLFRVFTHPDDPEEEYMFMYFTQIIELPDGELLVGMQEFDDRYEDLRYPTIYFFPLSQIRIAYNPYDEEDMWE